MFTHTSQRLAAALLIAPLALTLAACTNQPAQPAQPASADTPDAPEASLALEVGTCIAGAIDNPNGDYDPDLTTAVDCSEPHIYELTGFVDVEADWIDPTGTLDEIAAQRDEVITKGGEHYEEFSDFADAACTPLAAIMAGVDLPIGGAAADESSVFPAGLINGDRSIPAPERISELGKVQITCAVRFVDGQGRESVPVSSTSGTAAILEFLRPAFPIEARSCVDRDNEPVPCAGPHKFEDLVRWDANAVLGADFVTRVAAMLRNGESLGDEDYEAGDAACEAAYADAVGTDPDSFVLLFDMFNDWAELDGASPVGLCMLAVPDWRENDVTGSLIGLGGEQPERSPVQG